MELLGKPGKLVICGGGHVAQQAVILAKHTGFHVTVLEDRPFFADQARAAGADQVICDDFASALEKFPEAVILIFWLLQEAIGMMESALLQFEKERAYVGMMASRKRGILLKKSWWKRDFRKVR